jgi:hypothetical protein
MQRGYKHFCLHIIHTINKEMKTFNDLEFTTLPEVHGIGIRARIMFDNGFGVCVIQSDQTYGGLNGEYELSVLDHPEGNPVYYTPITNDVIGYLSESEVSKVMSEVQELRVSWNKNTEDTFLTTEQIGRLEDIHWNVMADPVYIKLYQDEMINQAWVALCDTLGVDINTDHVRILCIAKQVPNY